MQLSQLPLQEKKKTVLCHKNPQLIKRIKSTDRPPLIYTIVRSLPIYESYHLSLDLQQRQLSCKMEVRCTGPFASKDLQFSYLKDLGVLRGPHRFPRCSDGYAWISESYGTSGGMPPPPHLGLPWDMCSTPVC